MTIEEFNKVKFTMCGHLSTEKEYCTNYTSEDGIFGVCVHTPRIGEFEFGKSYRHYRIGATIYKTREKFLEALAGFQLIKKTEQ